MHVSAFTPHQCSFVHIQVRDRSVFIHILVLSPDACGTTRPRQRTRTCEECHRSILYFNICAFTTRQRQPETDKKRYQ